MGFIVYLFAAVSFVLVTGWMIYVLPTPGPLSPLALSVALIPVFTILAAVIVGVTLIWLALHLGRAIIRLVRR